ncbi:3'-phosphoadenosine 5'-phosphosulfate sulfotransferase (PAPS reductase)/FAD synthetase [Paenibacillus sp. LBL]|uniref:phosphoadenosine phosphosulfate reductase domain-containing protein n=1 Tax=Paenibacillus sp. LBL TaxID=2940563 RepID=UPI002476FB46|nr:phosphoadenosine phosphosulfate reductase family protein [Paenibacillus sp. LBL]MDH6674999.1 3'-phosphoadenosine 5'-phosphosulfate sulfotransferase (PAPS reductase)/FAD synthetase [Paenibacillus sp. LBL]
MVVEQPNLNIIRTAEQYVLPQLPYGMLSMEEYDEVHINVSGGIDSVATTLVAVYGYHIPKEKIKLVHMRVDGDPNDKSKRQLFDWPQTDEYLEYFAKVLDLPLIVIWGDKSLEERIRERGKFPDSKCRFCTSYMKRDVYSKWVRQFDDIKILLLTGERSEESTERAEKDVFSVHSANATGKKNRLVHWLKPIKDMLKFQVRQLASDYGIELHPCYEWVSRCSCKFCIFNTTAEMSRTSRLFPDDWEYLKQMERDLGHTMKSKKGKSFALGAFIKEDQIPLF